MWGNKWRNGWLFFLVDRSQPQRLTYAFSKVSRLMKYTTGRATSCCFATCHILRWGGCSPHSPPSSSGVQRGSFWASPLSDGRGKKTSPVSTRRSWRRGETAFWTWGNRFQRGSGLMAAVSQAYPSEEALLPDALSNHGGSAEKLSPSAVNRLLMELVMYFGRALLVLYPVYLSGYLGFSVSWVLLCMVMVTWWKKNRQYKDTRIGTAIEFVDNESQVVHQELRSALQMASWVCAILGGVNRWSLAALLQGTRAAQGFRFRGKDVKPVSCLIITIADISAAMKTQASLTPCYHDYNWVASRD